MLTVREGQKFEYLINNDTLAEILGVPVSELPELEKLDFSTASDNGNAIRVEQDRNHGTLTAGAPGYAAVTTVVTKRDGAVVAVLGEQFYVARTEQGEIADGELPVREISQARAASALSAEAPETNSASAATNEVDEESESSATV